MRVVCLSLLSFFLNVTSTYSQSVDVTFQVDMSAETVAASGVHIAGNFQSEAGLGNDWNPASTPMQDPDGDDIFEITVSLPPGTYEYKYVNGNAWGMDENPPSECSVGSTNNRIVAVGNTGLVLPAVPFNGCIPKLRLAVNMVGQEVAPEGVHVMGDFQEAAGFPQDWDPGAVALQDQNQDGTYEVELVVPPGNYQYLFVNGNTASAAEDLPGGCTVPGDNGSRNRAFNFAAGNGSPAVPCFSSCEECHPSVVFEYDAEWWNDAVFYEIFVRSFYDSDGDGIGDFQGMTEKLDYLNDGNPDTHDDLGITGIWLMPMMASPSYHGYDITDYYATEPDYGTMEDFEAFLDAAHQRGIKVIIDLVLNHSSSEHPWFIQSANNTGGYRDWYIWSDNNPGQTGPWGQPIWHPRGGDYYYGLFWSGMPDLNYTHPPVKEEMFRVADFWLGKGVDGYRLDAIKYLVEDGNILEDADETFALLEEFNTVYKTNNPGAFTVGEVWSNTASIIPYVQNDRLDACFEFGLAGAILDAANNGNPASLEGQLMAVQAAYPVLQYATFLTNHDIDRVFSTLGSDTQKMKLAASLYLTLPGIPFIYYGEEVGMAGTGAHPNIRRPMQWSGGANAGFSTVTPWQPPGSNYATNNVTAMANNPSSLLQHYRRLIRIRNEQPALRRGRTVRVEQEEANALSFARVYEDEAVIVVANVGTTTIQPSLSLPLSSLPAGEYSVSELLTQQSIGTVTIGADGGFAGWRVNGRTLPGRSAWILSLSLESPANSAAVAAPASHVRLLPNPAQGRVQISWEAPVRGAAQVQVFSAAGRLFYSGVLEQGRLDVDTGGWPAGVYFVQVWDEGRRGAERLVVVR